MISKKLAGILLGVSVIGGMVAGGAASVWVPDRPSAAAPTRPPVAEPLPDVEVIKPVLVMNDDGTATLSATLVNHTQKALEINNATSGQAEDLDAPQMLVHGVRQRVAIEPEAPIRIGGVGDDYRLRVRDRVQVGSTLPVTLLLIRHEGFSEDRPLVTFVAPVVPRTAAYADVANNVPNDVISVRDGKIVVVPGQEKAYIGGRFETTIADSTEIRPVAVGPRGRPIDVLHQTATGGPSGFFASPGREKGLLGYSPYLDDGGDRDYVRASDVEVGQTIRMTFRFPSGDVVGRFTVVQGNADGTI